MNWRSDDPLGAARGCLTGIAVTVIIVAVVICFIAAYRLT